jgi:DNA-binding response OmpR family regulator
MTPHAEASGGRSRDDGQTASARILILEDEPLVAIEMMRGLVNAGFEVTGPALTVAKALTLIESEGCDAAVLDIRLGSETSEPVAEKLLAEGIPFVSATGLARDQQPGIFQSAPMLSKPIRMHELIQLLRHYVPEKE